METGQTLRAVSLPTVQHMDSAGRCQHLTVHIRSARMPLTQLAAMEIVYLGAKP
jgi:hypothetical protein